MTWSLNEIGALAVKAARGGGLSWGLAEEAGFATVWLARSGFDAARILAAYLPWRDGVAHADLAPRADGTRWWSSGGGLCPIVTGAALCDFAPDAGRLTFQGAAHPLLLLPFVQRLAQKTDQPVAMTWPGASFLAGPAGIIAPRVAGVQFFVEHAEIEIGVELKGAVRRGLDRCDANLSDIEILQTFAHRTYAPATEASRIGGAGAGLSDND